MITKHFLGIYLRRHIDATPWQQLEVNPGPSSIKLAYRLFPPGFELFRTSFGSAITKVCSWMILSHYFIIIKSILVNVWHLIYININFHEVCSKKYINRIKFHRWFIFDFWIDKYVIFPFLVSLLGRYLFMNIDFLPVLFSLFRHQSVWLRTMLA